MPYIPGNDIGLFWIRYLIKFQGTFREFSTFYLKFFKNNNYIPYGFIWNKNMVHFIPICTIGPF